MELEFDIVSNKNTKEGDLLCLFSFSNGGNEKGPYSGVVVYSHYSVLILRTKLPAAYKKEKEAQIAKRAEENKPTKLY